MAPISSWFAHIISDLDSHLLSCQGEVVSFWIGFFFFQLAERNRVGDKTLLFFVRQFSAWASVRSGMVYC